jgi:hypothetical protein
VRRLLGLVAVLGGLGLVAPAADARVNALCTAFRAADATAFAQIFPGSRGADLCSRVQGRREACVVQTTRDLQAPSTLFFQFSCRTPVRRLRAAAAPKLVTQFILAVKRKITSLGPVTIGLAPAGFHCGVRRYAGRATDVCVSGAVGYGKLATGTLQVSPAMGCDVRPLVALRVANGNWDIFQVAKAPRTLNGPPCPGPHF